MRRKTELNLIDISDISTEWGLLLGQYIAENLQLAKENEQATLEIIKIKTEAEELRKQLHEAQCNLNGAIVQSN